MKKLLIVLIISFITITSFAIDDFKATTNGEKTVAIADGKLMTNFDEIASIAVNEKFDHNEYHFNADGLLEITVVCIPNGNDCLSKLIEARQFCITFNK